MDDKTAGGDTAGDKTVGDKTVGDKTVGDKTVGDKTVNLHTEGDNTPTDPPTRAREPVQDRINSDKVDKSSVDKGSVDNDRADKGRADKGRAGKSTAPSRPRGPNATAIVLGLVAMFFAGLIIAKETMGLRIDWSRLGPGAIVGLGVVMLLIGAIGLIRRQDNV